VIQSTGIQQVFGQLYQTVRSSLYQKLALWTWISHSGAWISEKYNWCAIVKIWCSLSHRAGVASTYSESKNTILHWKLRGTIARNQRLPKEWQSLMRSV